MRERLATAWLSGLAALTLGCGYGNVTGGASPSEHADATPFGLEPDAALGAADTGVTGSDAPAATQDAAPADASPPHNYTCTAVGNASTDGFFTLRAFAGKLYAGQFGYGYEAESMLFSYPNFQRVTPGLTGISESICAMREFNGYLYANTEMSGDMYRSSDGKNWTKIFDGSAGAVGCGLATHGNYLYAVIYFHAGADHSEILRSADGVNWTKVYDTQAAILLREIVVHEGRLYAFALNDTNSATTWVTSEDGTNWTSAATPARFFRGYSWKGKLWIGSGWSFDASQVGIWSYATGGSPTKVFTPADRRYVTEFAEWDGALFVGSANGWKTATGDSSLLVTNDGQSWKTACTFAEAAVWSIAPANGHLYVGTWEYGSRGKLYEVSVAP